MTTVMTDPDAVLLVENLDVTFEMGGRQLPILRDVSLALRPGEVLGVIGESGSGKSTLAVALLGVLPGNARITQGRVQLGNIDLTGLCQSDLRPIRGAQLAMIFQDPLNSLNPTFKIAAQMRRVLSAHGTAIDRATFRRRATHALSRVGIPDPAKALDRYPHQFSGGMRQRILIAMALLLRPKVIIADEPTSALDVTLQAQILELLRDIVRENGTSLIFISHDLRAISMISDKVAVLYAGRIVEQGPAENVLSTPLHPYTKALIGAAPSLARRHIELVSIPGRVPDPGRRIRGCSFRGRCFSAFAPCDETKPQHVSIGATLVSCHRYDRRFSVEPPSLPPIPTPMRSIKAKETASTSNIVSVRNVETTYADHSDRLCSVLFRPHRRIVLGGVSLDIGYGETVGIVGESGAGKTTLAKSIAGLLPISAGTITFDGVDIARATPAERRQLRSRAQFVFQDAHSSLSPRMRISSLLREPAEIHGLPSGERFSPIDLLAMVELGPEHVNKYPHELSGGQARRIGLARALSTRPDLIIADEPSAGLDVSAAASILNLIKRLKREWGTAYLIITHDLDLLGYVADRIAVMYNGKIVETGAADAVLENPSHPYTRQLLSALSARPVG